MNASASPASLRPGFITGFLAPFVVVLVGALIALVAGADIVPALRTGVRSWLVLQGSGIELESGTIGLVPLGGALLTGAVTARVAHAMTPEPLEAPGAFAATVAGSSGVVAAILASVTSTSEIVVHPVRAAAAAFVVSGLGAAVGATLPHGRSSDLWPASMRRPEAKAVVRAAASGAVSLLAAGAVVVAVLLVLHVERAAQLWALLDPGASGTIALALICLLAVPTLVLWAVAVLIGPGFALGAQTSVDLTGAQLGAVPGLPVLAGLPSPGVFPGFVVGLGLLPLLAGVVAGWRVQAPVGVSLGRRTALGVIAGAGAGLVIGVLVGASGGAVGPGRLTEAGPPALTPLLVAVPVLAVGGAIGAAVAHYRDSRAPQPSERPTRRPRLRFRHQPPGPDRRDPRSWLRSLRRRGGG